MRFPTRRSMILTGVAIASAAWATHSLAQHANAAGGSAPTGATVKKAPMTPTEVPGGAQPATRNPDIKRINDELKALREQFHSQLDPLEAQIKSLRDQFEPKIKSLEEQKKTLVEQGKPPAVQELDRQEESELAALADREKADIDGVKKRYADERASMRQKYDAQRKELLAGKR